MANDMPRDTEKNGSWQLLGEFKIDNVDDNYQHLNKEISEVIRGLNIQPSQLDRILNALMGVIQKASLIRAKETSSILLRIWAETECLCGRGWGFFVVEQPFTVSPDISILTMYLVELFLYQE